ncbi:MAG: hypothetical protein ABSB88_26815 [Bryobacteraceae bacterium]|jgi:hypothetical protein
MNSARTAAIRRAVASGDFPGATNLWNEYANLLQGEISRGVCTQAHMEEARELLEWSRRTVALARTHAQSRLDALRVAEQYLQRAPRSPALLRTCL